MKFSNEEKIRVFDLIANEYFNKNFGSMSKSDYETLLFSEYVNHCIDSNEKYDDYTLSKALGITQTRIRALKERKELKYPYIENQWKLKFIEALKYLKYDKQSHQVKVYIEDVNLLNEVRHHINSKGWYDEYSLNRNLLVMSVDGFIEVFTDESDLSLVLDGEVKKKVKGLNNKESSLIEFANNFTKEGLKDFAKSASIEAIKNLVGIIPGGNIVAVLLNGLITLMH